MLRSGLTLDSIRKIQTQRLNYFEHVERMRVERLPYVAMYGRIDGKRGRGSPRKRWLDCIEEDCKDKGLTLADYKRGTGQNWVEEIHVEAAVTHYCDA